MRAHNVVAIGRVEVSGPKRSGGQGWIRTSVRKPGQIYSLLPLTTRPPAQQVLGRASPSEAAQ